MARETIDSREINWTLSDGESGATVTVSLVRVKDTVGRDDWTGEELARDRGASIQYEASAEGHGILGTGITRDGPMVPEGYAAVDSSGRLVISAENLERIDEARDELLDHPEYRAQEERREEMAEFERRRDELRRKMDDEG